MTEIIYLKYDSLYKDSMERLCIIHLRLMMKQEQMTVLLAKEETVLQGMIDRLIEILRCCRMEMNVNKIRK